MPALRTRAAASSGGGRPVPVPGSGRVRGPGSGPGSDLGSLPGLVLFESGLKGMGRSATRTRPDPLRIRIPPTDV